MLTRILFYLLLYPLSLLSMKVLYGISYIFYLIIAYIIRYRSKIIDQNLRNSFPEMSAEELRKIKFKNYRHLADLAAEMIKMLSISRKNLMKRYHCLNPELVNQYADAGKSVILMSSHLNNWEWMVLSLDLQFKHQGIGVGAPNSNKVFELIINRFRTRYGTQVVFADKIREEVQRRDEQHIPTLYMMLSDQSPPNAKQSYKTTFLHQPSAMLYGSEYFAGKYNFPVLYYEVMKIKRGYYTIEIQEITDNPAQCQHGEIIENYVQLLERSIRKQPEFWLWSHKRWKHKITLV